MYCFNGFPQNLICMFSFSFNSKYFLISFLIYPLTMGYLELCYLISNIWGVSRNLILLLISFLRNIYLFIYLFGCAGSQLWHVISLLLHTESLLWHAGSFLVVACGLFSCGLWDLLVAACGLLAVVCRIQFPDQGLNPGPLHWEHRVLTTGPPGKYHLLLISN